VADEQDHRTRLESKPAPVHAEPEAAAPSLVRFVNPIEEDDAEPTEGPRGTRLADTPPGPQNPALSNASIHGAPSVIGLDAGPRRLKIVHLQTNSSEIRLVDAQATELPTVGSPERLETMAREVRDFLDRARPRVRAACCALSGEDTATLCCSMPRMNDRDLAQAVRWKVAEAASLEADKATVGYCVQNPRAMGNLEVIAAAVPRDVGRLDHLFPGDRPRLAAVLTEPLAAENVVTAAYHAQEHGPVAVLDIGAEQAKLSVVGESGLAFTRDIPLGGDSITAALVGKMNLGDQEVDVTRQMARRIKEQYRIGDSGPFEVAGTPVPGARILGAIRPTLERLASEVVRSLQFYAQSHNLHKVERVLLCGGGALMDGLPEYLTREMRVPTALLDPWRMLGFEIPAELDAEPAAFAVATGAAIHNAGRINLLPPHIRARRVIRAVRTGSLVLTGCLLAALLGLGWTANQKVAERRTALRQMQEATVPMETLAEQIDLAREQQEELNRRRQILRRLGVGRPIHAAVLKELSNLMPEGTYLRSLSFQTAGGVRKIVLDVDIYAVPSVSPAGLKQRLIRALEASPFFVNVSFAPAPRPDQDPARRPDEALRLTCQVLGFPGG
jgi:type IV pilus assembly protein PilM